MVWHARGAEPPASLLDVLRRRGLKPDATSSAHVALGWACGSSGPDRSEPVILVLDRPRELPGAEDVLGVLAWAGPGVVCWLYDSETNPRLSAVVPSTMTRGSIRAVFSSAPSPGRTSGADSPPAQTAVGVVLPAVGGVGGAGRSGASPALKLAGTASLATESGEPVRARPSARELLTDEELAMLLSEDPAGGVAGSGSGGESAS